jgi:secretion/DNA translocation related TadE-like protein
MSAPAPPPPSADSAADAGSATVLALIAGAVIAAAMALLACVTLVLYAQHRVSSAADLAALGGAQHLTQGSPAVCSTAADIAESNHTELIDCRVDTESVSVTVRLVTSSAWWSSWADQIVGQARAGYASP